MMREFKELQKTVTMLEHDLEIKNKIIKNYEKQLNLYATLDKQIKEQSIRKANND
jgi:hypothetical protein